MAGASLSGTRREDGVRVRLEAGNPMAWTDIREAFVCMGIGMCLFLNMYICVWFFVCIFM